VTGSPSQAVPVARWRAVRFVRPLSTYVTLEGLLQVRFVASLDQSSAGLEAGVCASHGGWSH
jgi:hypothetical protein